MNECLKVFLEGPLSTPPALLRATLSLKTNEENIGSLFVTVLIVNQEGSRILWEPGLEPACGGLS